MTTRSASDMVYTGRDSVKASRKTETGAWTLGLACAQASVQADANAAGALRTARPHLETHGERHVVVPLLLNVRVLNRDAQEARYLRAVKTVRPVLCLFDASLLVQATIFVKLCASTFAVDAPHGAGAALPALWRCWSSVAL